MLDCPKKAITLKDKKPLSAMNVWTVVPALRCVPLEPLFGMNRAKRDVLSVTHVLLNVKFQKARLVPAGDIGIKMERL